MMHGQQNIKFCNTIYVINFVVKDCPFKQHISPKKLVNKTLKYIKAFPSMV